MNDIYVSHIKELELVFIIQKTKNDEVIKITDLQGKVALKKLIANLKVIEEELANG